MLITYIIIGLFMLVLTNLSMIMLNPEAVKTDIRKLAYWVTCVICALLWPLMIVLTICALLSMILKKTRL